MPQIPGATPISIRSSFAGRKRAYDGRKRMGLVAAGAWVWSLLLLAFASIAPGAGLAAILASVALGSLVVIVSTLAYRREVARWSGEAESCSTEQSCGNESCSSEGGSCSARLEREMASKVLEMEQERLRITLRTKYGPDLVFFALWAILGAAISARASTVSISLAAALVTLSSMAVLAARLRLSTLVFGR
ncbi:MAG: hypothetical protein M0Z29_09165 [Actinomycetota bacterium]|nr:hypothetical protein [Actinomycetota bacterium]